MSAGNQIDIASVAYTQSPITYDVNALQSGDASFRDVVLSRADPNRDGVIEAGSEAMQAAMFLNQMDFGQDGIVDLGEAHQWAGQVFNNGTMAINQGEDRLPELQDKLDEATAEMDTAAAELTAMFGVNDVSDISVAQRLSNPQARALYNTYVSAKNEATIYQREIDHIASQEVDINEARLDMFYMYGALENLVLNGGN